MVINKSITNVNNNNINKPICNVPGASVTDLRRGGRYATSQFRLFVKSNVKQMCL